MTAMSHLAEKYKDTIINNFNMPLCISHKERSQRKKNRIIWEKFLNRGEGSDSNPQLDVYLPNYFWHAKSIVDEAHNSENSINMFNK